MKINTKIKQIKFEPEYTIKLIGIRITGHAKLKLMTGDIIEFMMDPETLIDIDNFSEEDIFNSINDGGFGDCEILSADINIYGDYHLGGHNNILVCVPIKKARVDMVKRKITYKRMQHGT